jgi:tetratricopeptide (TPR) repeat protein
MVAEPAPARFTFHDLLRAYAAEQTERHDTVQARRAAAHRMLDHYLHTAMAAKQRFSPFRAPLRLEDPQPGAVPADVADKDQAMAWFDAEAPALLALISYADGNGFETHAWQIPWALGPFFNRRGRWQEYVATQRIALSAARRLTDTLALAHAHYLLGHAQAYLGEFEQAEPNMWQALDMFRDLGDRANEAVALHGLSLLLDRQERYTEALAVALDALRIAKAHGHWQTQATMENGVGWLYAHLGQYDQALTYCQRALGLHRESGHRSGVADTLDSLGYIYRCLSDYPQARAHYEQAIEVYREMGAPFGEGHSLYALGNALASQGDVQAARAAWVEAVATLDRLPHPLADEIRAKLRGLDLAGTATTAR